MIIVNIREAKTQLSRLVDQAARGEDFVIARAGKPLVRVSAIDSPPLPKRFGFMARQFDVPDDFNTMGASEIAALFGTGRKPSRKALHS